MQWINIPMRVLRSPEFIGSDPVSRSTWLSVLGYCCEQENGGRIDDCDGWGDRRWMQTCGVTKAEVAAASLLLESKDGSVSCLFYPIEKELEVKAKREGGRRSGLKGGLRIRVKDGAKDSLKDSFEVSFNGKERKGKEGERKDIPEEGRTPGLKVTGYGVIRDPKLDPIDLASAVTGDYSDLGRGGWRKSLAIVGDERFRSCLETVWGDKNSGDSARNWAAVFSEKLRKVRVALAKPSGKAVAK